MIQPGMGGLHRPGRCDLDIVESTGDDIKHPVACCRLIFDQKTLALRGFLGLGRHGEDCSAAAVCCTPGSGGQKSSCRGRRTTMVVPVPVPRVTVPPRSPILWCRFLSL